MANVSNSLHSPKVKSLQNYPNYRVQLKDYRVLCGIDEVELRVISFSHEKKIIQAIFHASSVLNPAVSTGRAILLTYLSMRNTVTQIIRRLF